MSESAENEESQVLETFQEALKYYEKLSESFKLIGEGYSKAVKKIDILKRETKGGSSGCSCDHISIISRQEDELKKLRLKLESKQREADSLNAENIKLRSKMEMMQKAAKEEDEGPSVFKTKLAEKQAEKQKVNAIANELAKKEGEGMEIKISGDKNYEEEYFQHKFEDNFADAPNKGIKRKRVLPTFEIPSAKQNKSKADKKFKQISIQDLMPGAEEVQKPPVQKEAKADQPMMDNDEEEDSLSVLINMMDNNKPNEAKNPPTKKTKNNDDDLMAQLFENEDKPKSVLTQPILPNPIVKKAKPVEEEKKPNDTKDQKPKTKEIKEVRTCKNKNERSQLKGIACKDCQDYYNMFGAEKGEELCQKCSKHRDNIPETSTPEDFYDIEIK